MLMQALDVIAQAIPNPPPAAPADLAAKAATVVAASSVKAGKSRRVERDRDRAWNVRSTAPSAMAW